MSASSFYGFNVSTRSLMASQAALNVVNNNISNANTAGYTQETVNLTEVSGNPDNPTASDFIKGQLSSEGVGVQSVTRSYNNYLATTWRTQNTALQQQTMSSNVLQQIQNLVPTTSGTGINQAMTNFYSAAQTVANTPSDPSFRAAFLQSASNLVGTFQNTASQLQALRNNIVGDPSSATSIANSQVGLTVTDINNSLNGIAVLNKQIAVVEAAGGQPNNLLDQRDLLLDKLSGNINISVNHMPNDQVTIQLGNNTLLKGAIVVNTLQAVANPVAASQQDTPTIIQLAGSGTDVSSSITGGNLGGYLQQGNTISGQTNIPSTIAMLNTLFGQIATTANNLQANGYDLNGTQHSAGSDAANTLFSSTGSNPLALMNFAVNSALQNDPKLLAAAGGTSFSGVGDGSNMQALADSGGVSAAGLGNTSPNQYLTHQFTTLGNSVQSAQNAVNTATTLLGQTNTTRQSQQGVNIETEMVNLLQYQRSFEASSKVLNTMNDIMKTLIATF